MPNGLVTSFIDSVPTDKTGTQIRIGGTEAPTAGIKIKGQHTFVVAEYDYDYIPPMLDVTLKESLLGLSGSGFEFDEKFVVDMIEMSRLTHCDFVRETS